MYIYTIHNTAQHLQDRFDQSAWKDCPASWVCFQEVSRGQMGIVSFSPHPHRCWRFNLHCIHVLGQNSHVLCAVAVAVWGRNCSWFFGPYLTKAGTLWANWVVSWAQSQWVLFPTKPKGFSDSVCDFHIQGCSPRFKDCINVGIMCKKRSIGRLVWYPPICGEKGAADLNLPVPTLTRVSILDTKEELRVEQMLPRVKDGQSLRNLIRRISLMYIWLVLDMSTRRRHSRAKWLWRDYISHLEGLEIPNDELEENCNGFVPLLLHLLEM